VPGQDGYRRGVIDPGLDTPVYVQLAAILRGQIQSGELQPRRPIPSIRTLQQTYGVSDGTVKKAVQLLRDEGLVRTVKGRGVYVSPSPQHGGLTTNIRRSEAWILVPADALRDHLERDAARLGGAFTESLQSCRRAPRC
jgi:GntR family transcriptional regulator